MISLLSDNIISPLGVTSQENWDAVVSCESGVIHRGKVFGVGDDFTGSLLDRDSVKPLGSGYTFFETLMIRSAEDAIERAGIDPSDQRVVFVISTTKGNSDLIGVIPDKEVMLWYSAGKIASYFRNPNTPVVVSNACISGGCAQYVAKNLLDDETSGINWVVAVGGDVMSKFIISGFQSFKALSHNQCRPFDISRDGLNLGEGAATMIFSRFTSNSPDIVLTGCALRNDANHISGPSRTGEGLHNAIESAYSQSDIRREDTAFICAHGTSTMYNDEMESIAFTRSCLSSVPVTCLKQHFGHTLGAAGLLEAILSIYALRNGVVPPITTYSEKGVSGDIAPVREVLKTDRKAFLKTLSGFAGCNAALIYEEMKVCR